MTLEIDSPSSSHTWTHSRSGSSPTRRSWYETEKRFGFGSGTPCVPLGPGLVDVPPVGGPDVAGDVALSPAEVVGRRDVAQEVEARLVAEVAARLHETRRIDDDGGPTSGFACLDDAGSTGDDGRAHSATPRIW